MRQIEPAKARGKFRPALWKDPMWVMEFKFDGTRYLMHIEEDGARFTSRRRSIRDGGFVEKGDNFPQFSRPRDVYPFMEGTVLDGELTTENIYCHCYEVTTISGSSSDRAIVLQNEKGFLHYHVFDVLYYKRKDLRVLPYKRRMVVRDRLVSLLKSSKPLYRNSFSTIDHLLHSVPCVTLEKEKVSLYRDILKRGGEGVIFKHIDAQYGERTKWVKLKKQNTWDVIITGYLNPSTESEKVDGTISATRYSDRGWIGSIVIGQWTDDGVELIEYGSVSGMDEQTRAMISRNPEKFIGKVIEIEAQERLASGKFRHPRFIRFREDKNSEDCIYEP